MTCTRSADKGRVLCDVSRSPCFKGPAPVQVDTWARALLCVVGAILLGVSGQGTRAGGGRVGDGVVHGRADAGTPPEKGLLAQRREPTGSGLQSTDGRGPKGHFREIGLHGLREL